MSIPHSRVPSADLDPTEVVRVADAGVLLGGRPILRSVDLTIHAGEVVTLLGANGSGKSTLVRAMLGLAPLHRGHVEIFGTPLDRLREWRRIGYVPQRLTATGGVPASVWEVVAAGRLAHRRPLVPMRRADRVAITDALAAVGLSGRSRDSCATLSGGQQQRVLIARALVGDPDLLVLDEPTAGVDLASQEALADILRSRIAAGTTIVLVAHELGPLTPLIGRSVVMRDGRVAYDGPPLESFQDVPHHHHEHAGDRSRVDFAPRVDAPLDGGRR